MSECTKCGKPIKPLGLIGDDLDWSKWCAGLHIMENTNLLPIEPTPIYTTLVNQDMDKIRMIVREEVAKAQYAGIKHNESLRKLLHTGLAIGGSRQDIYMLFLKLCNMFDIDPNELFKQPVEKHDGQLNDDDTHHVYYNNFLGIAIATSTGIPVTAREALSLLAWLRQEEETLEKLAKEQEQ